VNIATAADRTAAWAIEPEGQTMLSDTHPDAERVQNALLQQASPEERLAITLSLTDTVINLSRQTLDDDYPDLSQEDRNLKWIELHYGRELSSRVRNHQRDKR